MELVPHNNIAALEKKITGLARTHQRIWYAGDGLYSMYADFAPVAELAALTTAYEQLWLYFDDAHSVSWTGRHGGGHMLAHLEPEARTRTVVVGSLNKSFAAAGAALTFPITESARRVRVVGGPMTFSGPLQPPMLGVSPSEAPIRCIGAGRPQVAYKLIERLRAAGYFVNIATFPAVVAKRSGLRVTLTTHHTDDDIAGIVEALASTLPGALAEAGSLVVELERAFARQLNGRRIGPAYC